MARPPMARNGSGLTVINATGLYAKLVVSPRTWATAGGCIGLGNEDAALAASIEVAALLRQFSSSFSRAVRLQIRYHLCKARADARPARRR
jgi:hypothetical protein